jgi:hypothetical protein
MPDRPNLDYEPGPVGASYSRVGPPPVKPLPAQPKLLPEQQSSFRHEAAEEFVLRLRRNRRRRRPSVT